MHKKPKFNVKATRETILKENRFITDLFSILPIPDSKRMHDSKTEEEYLLPDISKPASASQTVVKRTNRAGSLVELQKRLDSVKNKRLTVKEKLEKKNVKNKIKKNERKNERGAKKKLGKTIQLTTKEVTEKENKSEERKPKDVETKPFFNKESKMVFSKIDFTEIGKKKRVKLEKDPKKILQKLEKQKQRLEKLEGSGEVDMVVLSKEKSAWNSALAKAQGQKVKDDPLLLKKSIKKREQLRRKSMKKWEERKKLVEKAKDDKQKKREENIQKKKEKKKGNKMKKAIKKGRIIL